MPFKLGSREQDAASRRFERKKRSKLIRLSAAIKKIEEDIERLEELIKAGKIKSFFGWSNQDKLDDKKEELEMLRKKYNGVKRSMIIF